MKRLIPVTSPIQNVSNLHIGGIGTLFVNSTIIGNNIVICVPFSDRKATYKFYKMMINHEDVHAENITLKEFIDNLTQL